MFVLRGEWPRTNLSVEADWLEWTGAKEIRPFTSDTHLNSSMAKGICRSARDTRICPRRDFKTVHCGDLKNDLDFEERRIVARDLVKAALARATVPRGTTDRSPYISRKFVGDPSDSASAGDR